ncbi:putative lipid II flippase FtsW [Tannockella kyphosi]|uniref:putative lipid II flippase FtsW n=1 Tax=Tannockella kyphosi TaxID=2899121 RepID=UPI0020124FB2|nr:putative lipid II flippase FtsW [Tannockella kyphosi]
MRYRLVIGVVLVIVFIGLCMVYSASNVWAFYKFGDSFYYIKRQLFFAFIGIVCMFIVSKIDYHFYLVHSRKLLLVTFILLILVIIPGVGSARGGSQSWFDFGIVSFQPSELFKVGIIIYSARYIHLYYLELKKISNAIALFVVILIGFGLIMLQPDFGSAIVMASSIVVMLLVTPLPFRYFVFLGLGGVAGLVGMIVAAPYRLERITAYLDPFGDPLGSGFQMIQSLYAIGPGGIVGVGYNNSIQKHFYLPEPQTDFIFAIYCEEFGLIGAIFLIGLYVFLIYLIISSAKECHDLFGCFLLVGIGSLLSIQALINLGVVVGIFPITGVTLPFFSYGGSSLTITLIAVGIMLNVMKQN